MNWISYWLKFLLKVSAASTCRRTTKRTVDSTEFLSFAGPLWLPPSQRTLDEEIGALFSTFGDLRPRFALDAGAALGMFSLPLLNRFPETRVAAFEPSFPERVLLRRNLKLNNLDSRASVVPSCLWSEDTTLLFRSHAYLSGVAGVAGVTITHSAKEKVCARSIDSWWSEIGRPNIDLLKMDIEGSEIEAVCGAREMLAACRPLLLIEAYHERDGKRTYDEVARLVSDSGYAVSESSIANGLLIGRKY